MRWRVWMTVASVARSVVATPAVRSKNFRIETAFAVSSAPWSMTLKTSSGVSAAADSCTPPVPQP